MWRSLGGYILLAVTCEYHVYRRKPQKFAEGRGSWKKKNRWVFHYHIRGNQACNRIFREIGASEVKIFMLVVIRITFLDINRAGKKWPLNVNGFWEGRDVERLYFCERGKSLNDIKIDGGSPQGGGCIRRVMGWNVYRCMFAEQIGTLGKHGARGSTEVFEIRLGHGLPEHNNSYQSGFWTSKLTCLQ